MPNQRDPKKKFVSIWMHENNVDALRTYSKDTGTPMSELIEEAIKQKCKEWGVDYKNYKGSKHSNRKEW